MTDADRQLWLRRLRFPAALEREYQTVYFERSVKPLRLGFGLVSIVLFAIFAKYIVYGNVNPFSIVMFGVPAGIFICTFIPGFRFFWKPFLAVAGTSAGLFLIYADMTNPSFLQFYPGILPQITRMAYSVTMFMAVSTLMIRLPFLWTTLSLAVYEGFSFYWAGKWFNPEAELMTQFITNTLIVGLALILAALSLERYHRSDFLSNRLLEEEREKSERLLLNVLPASVAERLKTQPEALADSFAEVTVLFADIVGFTPMASTMSALDLVALLNRVFSRFDELTEKYGLERIKTIGDAYMVAGGLPEPKVDHAPAVAHLALEMMDVVRDFPGLRLRIGIHTGAVVAGVIGTKRFLYDLWGDTVNVASRMESHGTPGVITVTEDCRAKLGDEFVFGEPIELDVKGKGSMRAFPLLAKSD